MTVTRWNQLDELPKSLSQDCGMQSLFDKARPRPVTQNHLEASFMGLEYNSCPAPERVWRVS